MNGDVKENAGGQEDGEEEAEEEAGEGGPRQPRVSKAQKRRDKKAAKEKERQLEIERQEEENKHGARNLEAERIKSILQQRDLALQEVPSDGDCLFAGLVEQLK